MIDLARIRRESGDTRVTRSGCGPRVRDLCDKIESLQTKVTSLRQHSKQACRAAGDKKRQLKHVKQKQWAAQKIVNKLPVDANGKPVVPCVDTLWIIGNDGIGCMGEEYLEDGVIFEYKSGEWWSDHWCLWQAGAGDPFYWDGPVYSRHDDAEAARSDR